MLTVTVYLLKIILISGLLYSYYRIFLADRHFHLFNRLFLLCIPLLALTLPFIRLPFGGYLWQTGQDIPSLTGMDQRGDSGWWVQNGEWREMDATGPGALSATADWTMLATIAYALTSLVLFYLFLRQLRYIQSLTRSCPMKRMGPIRLFITTEPSAPFSFLNRIFWNDQLDMNSSLGRQVFRHELNHVRQRHSLDLLFLRPLTALCWINPFFHLIYREIKVIHEFLADNDAIAEGDRYQYAEGLVWQTVRNPPSSLLHTFSGKTSSRTFIQSPIKRRITMITKTSRNGLLGRAMILPLLLLLCCAFAARLQSHSNTALVDGVPLTVVIDAGHGGIDPGAVNKDGVQEKDINLSLAEKIKQLGSQYNVRILLTRDKDELAGNKATKRESLEYRAQMANDSKADLFIAIHTDLQPSAYVKGFNVYVAENNTHYPQCVEFGSALTASLQKTYTTEVALRKRKENIYVLRNTNMPAVLLSFGNMNNEEDLSFIRKEDNQEKVARDVLEAIRTYAKAHPSH
jgi:N-acetylmuramoyl-L-alanine amidase